MQISELTIEQQFDIRATWAQIDQMSQEQAIEYAKELYALYKKKEAFYLPHVQKSLLGTCPHDAIRKVA